MAAIVRLGFFLSFFLLFLALLTLSHNLMYVYKLTAAPAGFSSLKNFQGSKKGDNIKGLYQVKKYLNDFGYLPTIDHNKDDEFDDELENAIMTYQLRYNLVPTGVLDSGTVSKMMAPRCGVPDIFNGTNTLKKIWNFNRS
ncbi:metalloendo ase 2-MMP-like [Olea europaea subsp. europaea]|uniref:Metalloendo ase 2-MMP-like n=1 Tax=Olea europaea subsp. europaea TaxID=158383 RepID=A0A8S0RY54_OLEEU|nr:metalloendo ase 2-MMP-like [Olea europaea subsp. europaea]